MSSIVSSPAKVSSRLSVLRPCPSLLSLKMRENVSHKNSKDTNGGGLNARLDQFTSPFSLNASIQSTDQAPLPHPSQYTPYSDTVIRATFFLLALHQQQPRCQATRQTTPATLQRRKCNHFPGSDSDRPRRLLLPMEQAPVIHPRLCRIQRRHLDRIMDTCPVDQDHTCL